ncbi:DUF6702 family protein [Pedobacter agri]|uniref:DUF6702 family protein n=1 Tax=Pedobacter agri TaxID=454586 RepID=UPI00292EA950|nr:DUF6702 family protein [Pedobacter agri]
MSKIKFIFAFLLCAYVCLAANIKHPLHVSTTELNYNQQDKTIEISCRIFTDDFESILAKNYKQKIDLSKPAMKNAMDEVIKKYIAAHLQIRANGKPISMNYIGFEIDHEATNIFLEVEKISNFKSAEVTNTILYDLFDDQMSIVHIVKGKTRKSSKILYPDKKFATNF